MSEHLAITDTIRRIIPMCRPSICSGPTGQSSNARQRCGYCDAAAGRRGETVGILAMTDLHARWSGCLHDVDLINLRRVSTVFQKEIVLAERRIFCADHYAADEFEMLVLSLYHKLNEERAELMAEGLSSGRFYDV